MGKYFELISSSLLNMTIYLSFAFKKSSSLHYWKDVVPKKLFYLFIKNYPILYLTSQALRTGELIRKSFCSFAKFPTCITENSAHAGSVILDCILSLIQTLLSTIQYYTYHSTIYLFYYNLILGLQKFLHLLAKEIHTQIHNSVWDSRLTHVLQRFVCTNFQSNIDLLDNHAVMFLCT